MTDESRKAFGDQFCVLKSKSGRGRELAAEMLVRGAPNSPGETGEDMVAPPHVSFIAACI